MYYNTDDQFEVEYFDKEDYEEARRKDSAKLHRATIQMMEKRYSCSYPEFIMQAKSPEQRSALQQWSLAIRYLARYDEKLYV
ncbi:hypothetical protein BEP19_04340 [Ammoniphilus oxalaticus]|uniref:Uncharacterized protein n=1 Tax=Ammoniphilus oxalaticus TaxID=66863 RepID=A0A419SLV7_9BACL|nr:hypothetical protein [Ammoniphilus oxalaticus]RKD25057.1 hypothetical protein BEP19_04340 [Ammoniphilus oxalaticus]